MSTNDHDVERHFRELVPALCVFKKREAGERDSFESIVEAMIDFTLLSRTKYIIGTWGSSYSEQAAHVHPIPKRSIKGGEVVQTILDENSNLPRLELP